MDPIASRLYRVCPSCEGTGDLHIADWDKPITLSGIVTCSIKTKECDLCAGLGYCGKEAAFEFALSNKAPVNNVH